MYQCESREKLGVINQQTFYMKSIKCIGLKLPEFRMDHLIDLNHRAMLIDTPINDLLLMTHRLSSGDEQ